MYIIGDDVTWNLFLWVWLSEHCSKHFYLLEWNYHSIHPFCMTIQWESIAKSIQIRTDVVFVGRFEEKLRDAKLSHDHWILIGGLCLQNDDDFFLSSFRSSFFPFFHSSFDEIYVSFMYVLLLTYDHDLWKRKILSIHLKNEWPLL
jgi:hypothetical protein